MKDKLPGARHGDQSFSPVRPRVMPLRAAAQTWTFGIVRANWLTVAATAVVAFACALYYPLGFVVTFQLLGPAVNSPTEGWLGPTPRDAGGCIVDAGKVNVWVCTDASVFSEHRYGCKKWLELFGFSNA